MSGTAARQPVRLLIAALGGEGGGVLVDWITRAATAEGLHATRTSIPGVAQRTGGTTYYVEVLERCEGDPPPVLGLNAAPGRVDVLLATELLEAARRAEAGFVTPDRTVAIVARRRAYTVAEKAEGGDGRLDDGALERARRGAAKTARIEDFEALAAGAGAPLNAVLLGALAASGALPVSPDRFRDAVRAGGKATEANLRGFEAGLSGGIAPSPVPEPAPVPADEFAFLPREAARLAAEGVKRLADHQDAAAAGRYLDTLRRFAALPGADAALLASLARHLALRMGFEDVIRVAQLKLREARRPRLAQEAKARPGDIVHVVEFMKPGPAEILSLLPPGPARALLGWVERRGWMDRSVRLNVSPTRPLGFLRLRLLAALRPWRPRTLRFHEERACRALARPRRAQPRPRSRRGARGRGDRAAGEGLWRHRCARPRRLGAHRRRDRRARARRPAAARDLRRRGAAGAPRRAEGPGGGCARPHPRRHHRPGRRAGGADRRRVTRWIGDGPGAE
jgi:indolepyruvate ferredoxin oxidoreductase beta subunit